MVMVCQFTRFQSNFGFAIKFESDVTYLNLIEINILQRIFQELPLVIIYLFTFALFSIMPRILGMVIATAAFFSIWCTAWLLLSKVHSKQCANMTSAKRWGCSFILATIWSFSNIINFFTTLLFFYFFLGCFKVKTYLSNIIKAFMICFNDWSNLFH